ncbi:3-hydroxy-3-methylglutaryl-coenzyme A reductase [Sporormia fimetaria CBS 119925]|uniref:3-hydroxy-3-methylglutaryl coenzyme A reductase n=1 Tax=Sporormia fimetaria CBS 119925 TaxID=1340428 RepID=A0A6A6VFI6_9PLEO|nr:3-hydroxy-3-methylglutaryl-coenzyme A reductase [Sporormia fimetaria CBS 119925]
MFGFLQARFQRSAGSDQIRHPGWYDRHFAPVLLWVAKKACTHPIHTIVLIASVASYSYLGVLDDGLLERTEKVSGKVDFDTLLAGSQRLHVGKETAWKWEAVQAPTVATNIDHTAQELALITFVFPESSSAISYPSENVIPSNVSAKVLPKSSSSFSTMSSEGSLAFAVPYADAPELLVAMQEIPAPQDADSQGSEKAGSHEEKKWIMKAARSGASPGGIRNWVRESWTSFVDLLKNADTGDIVIMAMGYLAMHLTFVSLFLSMRRLGSNFWLAATVLIQSAFAFVLALLITVYLGVPMNMVLLSEGLPFLVVIIGFEKPIVLTKAVLSASLDARRNADAAKGDALTIQNAVQRAIKQVGYEIVRDYVLEIAILVAGAMSGIQGGLRQFCFLGAWILFFDSIMLLTFFTAILTIKLEVNRIKRHVQLRRALEDDGVSGTVAESVAANNDWPSQSLDSKKRATTTIFGKTITVPKFKILMVVGFILVNILNVVTLRFGMHHGNVSHVPGVGTSPPLDPFKVAGSGLDSILEQAKKTATSAIVTVFTPIKYELEYPSVHYGEQAIDNSGSLFAGNMRSQFVDGVLKSLEDPFLGKLIIAALVMSVVLNGYLFNAARWTIKEPHKPLEPPKPSEVQEGAPPSAPIGIPHQHMPTPPITPGPEQQANRGAPQPLVERPLTPLSEEEQKEPNRPTEILEQLLKEKMTHKMTDEELIELSMKGKIPGYALEKTLGDKTRAVKVRRAVISRTHATRETSNLLERSKLPYKDYNYDLVHGACCENVIGYLPLPLGVAGPLMVDGQNYFIPMATTEGVLVASTSRGAKAINAGGGATTVLTADGMTRGPCVAFETLARAGAAKNWLDSEEGQRVMKNAFNSTSRFARLQSMKTAIAGTNLYIRFKTTTGDAMGMNMISKGVEHALSVMTQEGFEDMDIVSVSGNYCTDKKAAAVNWIDGRGKGIVAEAIIPGHIVKSVLKTDVDSLVELNINKNLIGSAMAGAMGGFNAHAANIVAAIFLATGQDPAQVVESANCITIMKNFNGNLQISVSMPSIEVGTIGGGTILEPQSAMLDLLGVRGAHQTSPGENARLLARIIGASVLAGELSLNAALAAGHLVRAHMAHNRSAPASAAPSRAPTPGAQTPTGVQTPSLQALTTKGNGNGPVPRR